MLEVITSPASLVEAREAHKGTLARHEPRFLVCAGTGCVASGSLEVYREFERRVAGSDHPAEVGLALEGRPAGTSTAISGCHGWCQMGPLVRFEPKGVLYTKVQVADVADIVAASLEQDGVVERLLHANPDGSRSLTEHEVPFYRHQRRIVLANCGLIDPENIGEYLAVGGYEALARVLAEYSPERVIDCVRRSGLRGRGGAGFPTGRKWASCRQAPGTPKYVVCNADEGDPGAFMDRSILEGNPHAVLEGMAIAAYAIGASQGYVYVRAEYPLAVVRLGMAIEQARRARLLGPDIMGTGFGFDIDVFQGAGAFVCGESTALVRSIEGFRGTPKALPRPRTTEEGLWGKPTLLNNVKTFAYVPEILVRGADWFANTGTRGSPGTAVFALAGKVRNSGLIEVPMGTSLREIIFDIGGGTTSGRELKAVQIGGPSGGCLPRDQLDLGVDFDSLLSAGSMMGSGGMVVLDEESCMVDIVRYFLEFTVEESCGQCVPCRLGTHQMLRILEDITEGRGQQSDMDLLEEISRSVISGSICGLGQSAPNPVLGTLRYFRAEYEAHVRQKSCPALYCKGLIAYWIDPDRCRACGRCRKDCPVQAIRGERHVPHVVDQLECTKCGICLETCPERFAAVRKVTGEERLRILEGVR